MAAKTGDFYHHEQNLANFRLYIKIRSLPLPPKTTSTMVAEKLQYLTLTAPKGVKLSGKHESAFDTVLTFDALEFVAALHRRFGARRKELLRTRAERQARLDAGELPDFLPETAHLRGGNWLISPLPADLLDRRVEITGPVERKMVINALNSGAKVFMADFEDSLAPSWLNVMQGQVNLYEAVRRTIAYTDTARGKHYELIEKPAVLFVRPRGWHLDEVHMQVDGETIAGAFLDFGLFFFNNAKAQLERGTGPYFYLPKLESHIEARLWNDIFLFAQEYVGLPQGTIKATVLIETILGAFEAEEILYELREHSAGLNCGRWDYIFSIIKKFARNPEFVMPDRSQVTMSVPCMKAYAQYVIKVCHQHGAPAMGGMSAYIPVRDNEAANEKAMAQVKADKEREATEGHDGTWVAHPGLIPVAKEVFDRLMPTPNQIHRQRDDVNPTAADLLAVPQGTITEAGLRMNIDVGIQYLESWLGSNGCVPIYNLMEDAATAEISRSQVWQWIHHQAKTEDGQPITRDRVRHLIPEILHHIKELVGEDRYHSGKYVRAAALFDTLVTQAVFEEFLTLRAYREI